MDSPSNEKPVKQEYPSPLRLSFLIVASIFTVEIAFMLTVHGAFGLSAFWEAILDASTVALLVTPALYFLIYRPFVQYIDKLKKAEEAMRESEEQFRGIFDYSKVGVNVLGADYNYLRVNKAFCDMIGYSEKELLTHDFKGITHPDDVEPNLILSKKLRNGEIDFFHMEKRYLHKNGTIVWGDLTVSSVRTEDGALRYVIAIIQDISKRKEAEQQLVAAKESAEYATALKDKFVSLVSHDLKSPLTTMIGFLKLVRHDSAAPLSEGALLILDRAIDQSLQMTRLIEDLLNLSRLKTGQLKLEMQFFDALYLGAKMIADFSSIAKQKGIELKNLIPQNSRIYSDKTLLGEVLHNLVTNAVKFCKKGDSITISLQDGEISTICVTDTGPGIPPAVLDNVLRYDIKTTTRGTAGETGTGLGLPLVKEIMTILKGEFAIESAPGKGSRIRLILPHVRPLILLVNDNPEFRRLQIAHLRELETDIIEAENGKDALEIISVRKPHLVISGLEMPVMGGLALLDKIKSGPDNGAIPFIIVSGKHEEEIRDEVFRLGADDFASNETDIEDFKLRVRRFIG